MKTHKSKPQRTKKICNFCGKSAAEVGRLIESNLTVEPVRICSICHHTCEIIFAFGEGKGQNSSFNKKIRSNINPKEIKDYLDLHVIGQDDAKIALSIAVSNHYKRIFGVINKKKDPYRDVVLEKSNVMLIGPTGSGKTFLIKKLAEFLNVPLAIGDATSITEAGYVGDDVESLISSLLRGCDYNQATAERGIIYIDEIDKIASSKNNVSISRDVGGEGVQQALLKLIEGTVANVPPNGGRKHPEQKFMHVDTTNILFICGGTFVGLEDIISRRNGSRMGFGAVDSNKTPNYSALPEDLVSFGLIPEFVGRFPLLQKLKRLSVEDLENVISNSKNSILLQYKKLFWYDEVELDFTTGAVQKVAEKAFELETGARGLKQIMERVLFDYNFNIKDYFGKKITIDEKFVKEKLE